MRLMTLRRLLAATLLLGAAMVGSSAVGASDWPEWRGPSRDGRSAETGLPANWSPKGENLAWRVPVGARSAPVAFRDQL